MADATVQLNGSLKFPSRPIRRRRFIHIGAAGLCGLGELTARLCDETTLPVPDQPGSIPDKAVFLCLDDAVKSHRTFVAPLLKELDFGATFFVNYRWMNDRENFMNWQEIAEVHQMGFRIGNHSWTHDDFSVESCRRFRFCIGNRPAMLGAEPETEQAPSQGESTRGETSNA